MRGLIFRCIGIVRAKANIAFTNMVYNICRYSQIPWFMLYNIKNGGG